MTSRPPPAPSRNSHDRDRTTHEPATTTTSSSSAASIRRNLFHHTLSKRTASASTSNASSAATLHVESEEPPHNASRGGRSGSRSARENRHGGNSSSSSGEDRDIVARDETGGYRVDGPGVVAGMPPALMDEEGGEEGRGEVEMRLIEMFRVRSQTQIEPNELKASLAASLQAKVASLEGDKWMFEAEDPVPR